MALTTSESIILKTNGTCASELRTRFCPNRFTYSVTTGSETNLELESTIIAYCFPILMSLSMEYQFPRPRPPILRLPMASTSLLPPSCFTLSGSAGWIGADCVPWLAESPCGGALPETPGSPLGTVPGVGWPPGTPVCAKIDEVRVLKVNNAAVNRKSRNFIAKLRFPPEWVFIDYTPGHNASCVKVPKKFDAQSAQKVIQG